MGNGHSQITHPCAFIASEISFLNISCLSSFSMSNSCCSLVRFMNCKKQDGMCRTTKFQTIKCNLWFHVYNRNPSLRMFYLSLHFFRLLDFLLRRRRFPLPPSLTPPSSAAASLGRFNAVFFALNISHGWSGRAHLPPAI